MSEYSIAPLEFVAPGYEHIPEFIAEPARRTLLRDNLLLTEQVELGEDSFVLRTKSKNPNFEERNLDILLFDRVEALYRGIGVVGLEQVVYYSLPEEKVVTKFVPGGSLRLPPDEIVHDLTNDRLTQLYTNLVSAKSAKVMPDYGDLDNFIFHPEDGITAIDYFSVNPDESYWEFTPGLNFAFVLYCFFDNVHYATDLQTQQKWREIIKRGVDILFDHEPGLVANIPNNYKSLKKFIDDPLGYSE